MSVIGLLIIQILTLRSSNGQFGGGGPSTFGYDGSSACAKPYSRNGRARYEKLPCDFRRQNWCTVAGSAYPWHAVRRFVQENQGLMRRMYGDERHINVLRDELEKNDVELEYEDRHRRYPEESRRFQYEDAYEFVNVEKRQRSKTFAERDSSTKIDEAETFTGADTLDEPSTEKINENMREYTRSDDRRESESTTTIPNLSGIVVDKIDNNRHNGNNNNNNNNSAQSNIVVDKIDSINAAVTSLADIARIKNSSINEIPGQSERTKDRERIESPIFTETTTTSIHEEDSTLEPETTVTTLTSVASSSGIDRIEDDPKNSSPTDRISASISGEQKFRPRPEYRPSETKTAATPVTSETPNIEGQLFQDVAAKDQQEQPVLKLRGVNACPVKEEVVAPFWANNTRGEVLALLNLYPFEQYVHWEKCIHENKQMYCRDGCRCEQQYRLHRLLAYDPNNECRGIFSDWFKFPSSCVCRCYDLPVEFRVTSRSPRIHKQKLRLRSPGVAPRD